jgi:phosphoribosyl 1,2-cyclic phosphodiesterase
MKLKVIGSGSSGNGYILKDSTEHSLVIEAGMPFIEYKKFVDFKINNIWACVISHAHRTRPLKVNIRFFK